MLVLIGVHIEKVIGYCSNSEKENKEDVQKVKVALVPLVLLPVKLPACLCD